MIKIYELKYFWYWFEFKPLNIPRMFLDFLTSFSFNVLIKYILIFYIFLCLDDLAFYYISMVVLGLGNLEKSGGEFLWREKLGLLLKVTLQIFWWYFFTWYLYVANTHIRCNPKSSLIDLVWNKPFILSHNGGHLC